MIKNQYIKVSYFYILAINRWKAVVAFHCWVIGPADLLENPYVSTSRSFLSDRSDSSEKFSRILL